MSKKVKIKQVRSTIKRLESQKRTLKALGLRKIGMEVHLVGLKQMVQIWNKLMALVQPKRLLF